MNLDEAQKRTVSGWIEQGLKLSEIQTRLETELGIKLTYMEVRLLVDDLKLMPKDQPKAPPEKLTPGAAPGGKPGGAPRPEEALPAAGNVSVTVDAITQPGALVSGRVTFSDGNSAAWFLDQMGRLGLAAQKQGYKPSAEDLEAFQMELHTQLQKMGF